MSRPKGATYALTRRLSVDPAEAFDELERIRKTRGRLSSADVVEEATPEASPIHRAFEWDDDKAGHEYRLMQARWLVRAVTVSVRGGEARSVYVHVSNGSDRSYEPMDTVVDKPDMFAFALAELERKLDAAQRSVDELKRMAGIGNDPERSARLIVAVEAFRAAQAAVRSLH